MAIQIKGINTELLLYKTELERKTPFSERMVTRVHSVIERSQCLPMKESPITKAREVMYGAQVFGYGLAAIAANEVEMKKKKEALVKATGFDSAEVAIDINELEKTRSKKMPVRVFGDSIRYSAQVRKEWLNGIEIIFGNADLQALDNFECLSSLKAIYGDLNLAQTKDSVVDLSPLQLQMVYGDIHAERAKSTAGLEGLLSVGGTIFYQDKAYDLDAFQQLMASEAIERQK